MAKPRTECLPVKGLGDFGDRSRGETVSTEAECMGWLETEW
jgi:hypothetical protein